MVNRPSYLRIFQEAQMEFEVHGEMVAAAAYRGYDYHPPLLALEFFHRPHGYAIVLALMEHEFLEFLNLEQITNRK